MGAPGEREAPYMNIRYLTTPTTTSGPTSASRTWLSSGISLILMNANTTTSRKSTSVPSAPKVREMLSLPSSLDLLTNLSKITTTGDETNPPTRPSTVVSDL